jgi:WD40 repeat protein
MHPTDILATMTAPTGPFQVTPLPGESFRLDDADPLDVQWTALLERLPPRARSFVVRNGSGGVVYAGVRPVEPLTDDPDVSAMAMDASGRWIATGHEDGSVRLWEMGSPDPVWSREPADYPIEGLAFVEPGGWLLAWCEDGPLLVIARESGELTTRIEDPQFASFTLSVSPSGEEVAITGPSVMRIAIPSGDVRVRLDADRGADTSSSVQWVEYVGDGSTIVGVRAAAVAQGTDEIVFWNAADGARIGSIPDLRGVCACDISPDRTVAAIASSGAKSITLRLVDTRTRAVLRDVTLPHESIYDLRFAPDGRTIWVAGLSHGPTRVTVADGSVSAPVSRELGSLCIPVEGKIVPDTHESTPIMMTHNPSGTIAVTSLIERGPFAPVGRAVSHDGSRYATSDEAVDNNHVLICDAASNRVVATLAHRANVREVAFAPDGSSIAVRAAGHVYVWPLSQLPSK